MVLRCIVKVPPATANILRSLAEGAAPLDGRAGLEVRAAGSALGRRAELRPRQRIRPKSREIHPLPSPACRRLGPGAGARRPLENVHYSYPPEGALDVTCGLYLGSDGASDPCTVAVWPSEWAGEAAGTKRGGPRSIYVRGYPRRHVTIEERESIDPLSLKGRIGNTGGARDKTGEPPGGGARRG